MKKARNINILNLICNIAIVGLVVGAVMLLFKAYPDFNYIQGLKEYTNLSSLITGLASFLMIIPCIVGIAKKRNATPRLFYTLRFISAVMNLVTIIVVFTVIVPTKTGGIQEWVFKFSDGTLFLNFIIPILTIASFVFLDIMPTAKFRKTFEPFVATLIYGIVMLTMTVVICKTQGVDAAKAFLPGEYEFMYILPELGGVQYVRNILINVILIAATYVLSVVVWGLNRIVSAIVIGVHVDQPVVAPKAKGKKGKTKIEEKTPLTKKESFVKFLKDSVSFKGENNDEGRVYHISYHDRRKKTWKVKGENAGRANKVFRTQKEAIEYANAMIAKNGGSIRVHSMVGKIRKE